MHGSITEETTTQRDGGCTWSSERSVSREPTWLLLILSFFNSIPPPAPSFSLLLSLPPSRLICTSREVQLIEEASGGFFLLSYRETQPDSATSVLAAHRFNIYLAELYQLRVLYYTHLAETHFVRLMEGKRENCS